MRCKIPVTGGRERAAARATEVTMSHRRAFLTRLPLGLAGLAAACNARGSDAGSAGPPRTSAPAAPAAGATKAAPLLREVPSGAPTLTWTPQHGDLVYTFGGAAPKHRIAAGTRIVSWTEDCFDGAVKTTSDLPSKVMTPSVG